MRDESFLMLHCKEEEKIEEEKPQVAGSSVPLAIKSRKISSKNIDDRS